MAKSEKPVLTKLELQIMQVIWKQGASTVTAVQEALPQDLAYTTVQTMLNILHRKGKLQARTPRPRFFLRGDRDRSQSLHPRRPRFSRPHVWRIKRRASHEPHQEPPDRRQENRRAHPAASKKRSANMHTLTNRLRRIFLLTYALNALWQDPAHLRRRLDRPLDRRTRLPPRRPRLPPRSLDHRALRRSPSPRPLRAPQPNLARHSPRATLPPRQRCATGSSPSRWARRTPPPASTSRPRC